MGGKLKCLIGGQKILGPNARGTSGA